MLSKCYHAFAINGSARSKHFYSLISLLAALSDSFSENATSSGGNFTPVLRGGEFPHSLPGTFRRAAAGARASLIPLQRAAVRTGETLGNLREVVLDVFRNKGNSKLLTYKADVYEKPAWITAGQFRDYITVGDRDAFAYLSVYFNVKDDNHPPLHFMALHTVSSVFRGKLTPLMGCGINLVCVLGIMVLLMDLGRILNVPLIVSTAN